MKHLAAIMDGNRRWAYLQGLSPWKGHEEGIKSIETVVNFCLKHNISYLSLYAFSLENFKRSKQELHFLFNTFATKAQEHLSFFITNGIQVRFIGDEDFFPENLKPVIRNIEAKTDTLTTLQLNFLFCYGSRQEIISAVKSIAQDIKSGTLNHNEITDQLVRSRMWSAEIPDPDLIIRTGGECRLSNFLLYQAAYSEFYFMNCLWPEINEFRLNEAFIHYNKRTRNYGS